MQQAANVVRLRARRSATSKRSLLNRLLNQVLMALLVGILVVGSIALWRVTTENTSQPHVPTWKKVAPQ